MKKVIRLTESDLMRIVKRVIEEDRYGSFGNIKRKDHRRIKPLLESSLSKSEIEVGIKKNLKTCFDMDQYPELNRVSNGSEDIVLGLLLIWAGVTSEIFSFGLSSVASVGVAGVGTAEASVGIRKIYDANINKIKNELEKLWKCVF